MRTIYRIKADIDEDIEIYEEDDTVWIYQGSERIRFSASRLWEVHDALSTIIKSFTDRL